MQRLLPLTDLPALMVCTLSMQWCQYCDWYFYEPFWLANTGCGSCKRRLRNGGFPDGSFKRQGEMKKNPACCSAIFLIFRLLGRSSAGSIRSNKNDWCQITIFQWRFSPKRYLGKFCKRLWQKTGVHNSRRQAWKAFYHCDLASLLSDPTHRWCVGLFKHNNLICGWNQPNHDRSLWRRLTREK